jgi:DNA polymerase III psi subunit
MSNLHRTPANHKPEPDEESLYRWQLTQRILFECGLLEPEKVSMLNEAIPGWYWPVGDDELTHALAVDDGELNSAFKAWWNLNGLSASH